MSNFCQNQMSKLYDLLDHNLVLGRGSVVSSSWKVTYAFQSEPVPPTGNMATVFW